MGASAPLSMVKAALAPLQSERKSERQKISKSNFDFGLKCIVCTSKVSCDPARVHMVHL